MFLLLVARQLNDVRMASTSSVHTVRKVTLAHVVIVQEDHTETTVTQDNHIMVVTLCL